MNAQIIDSQIYSLYEIKYSQQSIKCYDIVCDKGDYMLKLELQWIKCKKRIQFIVFCQNQSNRGSFWRGFYTMSYDLSTLLFLKQYYQTFKKEYFNQQIGIQYISLIQIRKVLFQIVSLVGHKHQIMFIVQLLHSLTYQFSYLILFILLVRIGLLINLKQDQKSNITNDFGDYQYKIFMILKYHEFRIKINLTNLNHSVIQFQAIKLLSKVYIKAQSDC
ncbi:hypothetical protein pb186bvf_014425 [Paramecium bursaria]